MHTGDAVINFINGEQWGFIVVEAIFGLIFFIPGLFMLKKQVNNIIEIRGVEKDE